MERRHRRLPPGRVSLTRATLGGGLYVDESLTSEAVACARVLGRPNPAYRRWLLHARKSGGHGGSPPPEHVYCGGPIPDGPRQGSWWLPRYAPVAVRHLQSETVLPLADRLELQGITLRPYQVEARDALLWEQAGTVVAPCGAGKTTIGAGVIAEIATPALVLVHTLDLATQWIERVQIQLGVEAGLVGDGRRDEGARVTVATIQTLARWSWWERYQWGRQFGLVVLDEAHHAPARTFAEVISALPGRYRLGLTATPKRRDGLTDFLYWTCGPIIYRIEQRHLEATGSTLRPRITWLSTGWAPSKDTPPDDWTALVGDLVGDEGRNALIVDEVAHRVRAGRTILVLSDRVQHAVDLAEQITARGIEAEPMVGRVGKRRREAILERARSGELQVITATSVADEGLDVPALDCVVLTCPSRNTAKVQQRVGRALRVAPDKEQPEVVDLVDDWRSAVGMAWQRYRLYRSLGWEPERPGRQV